ncbi:MAG: phosphoenolpyruvate carboxykinase (ATP), partial [Acidobacteria bacterium]|nr:phosphoenolpyruvate carboxykinase (ATP) [Acidobacteriota bacterium]
MPNHPGPGGLEDYGIAGVAAIHWNLPAAALYEEAVRRREGQIAQGGALAVNTGLHTGRSPNDKFIVREGDSEGHVDWGKVNCPISPKKFETLYARLYGFLKGKELFVQDCTAGADPRYQTPIRIITETAWHSLFSQNLFIPAHGQQRPEYTVIDIPSFQADPGRDGTHSGVFILVNLARKLVAIGGTSYAGEIKKSIFTIMNYRLPLSGVLSMHCSANAGPRGDVALFFGLSGTGKTTLSADPERGLIGDDEHGWSDEGIFNFEGGCYAKVIRLSQEAEPEIYACTQRFGTVLENVVVDPATRRLELNDDSLTENTRAAYPLQFISNAVIPSRGGHPQNIIMLTCDAFGVLPPIARLIPEQAMYHFLSGYTAKVAGTEKGLGNEPSATFSTCFGAPFMVLRPTVYAKLLGEKIERHQVRCWLVNTGWSGGPFGVGHRMSIAHTRAMIHAALNGKLTDVPATPHPIFRVLVPESCDGVPPEVLQPRNTWPDKAAYDRAAMDLAGRFTENFNRFSSLVNREVRA